MAKQVIVYTQPGWGSCEQEKEFLSRKGVSFVDKNIRTDPAALQELLKLGYKATPVTIIDGEAVVGFDRGKIERLLGLAWLEPGEALGAEREEECQRHSVRGEGRQSRSRPGSRAGAPSTAPTEQAFRSGRANGTAPGRSPRSRRRAAPRAKRSCSFPMTCGRATSSSATACGSGWPTSSAPMPSKSWSESPVDPALIKALQAARYMYLTTYSRAGRRGTVPVWLWYHDGAVYFTTQRSSLKARRIRNTGRVTVHVGKQDGPSFEGTAEWVDDRPDLEEALLRAYRRKHWIMVPLWMGRRIRKGLARKTSVLIRITPEIPPTLSARTPA